jgi:hypothetical protein
MRKLLELVQPDGAISTLRPGHRLGADHDALPGAVLLAIGKWNAATGRAALLDTLDASLAWYRRRFRTQPSWLATWWQGQAWSLLYRLSGNLAYADFVFELADWALERQLDKNGAFVMDLWPTGPSFHTACAAEAIGDAWAIARLLGDEQRTERYEQGWRAAVGFVDQLIMRHEDMFCVADPGLALGGVRLAPTRSLVRIDFVAHTLLALLKGGQLTGAFVE